MKELKELYARHLATLADRFERALEKEAKEGVLIAAGKAKVAFLDDFSYPFRVNPHFVSFVPVTDVEGCYLLFRPGEKPRLFFNQPDDYWHLPAKQPDDFWTDFIDIVPITRLEDAANEVGDTQGLVFIGEELEDARMLGLATEQINPESLLHQVHFERAAKTEYELHCMRESTKVAVTGHLAAREAFGNGLSEFDIHLEYLRATGSREQQTPYRSIIALNEHAAALHYQHYDINPPAEHLSFLIDAGAYHGGYASDITRTYTNDQGLFADILERMEHEQLGLISTISCGMNYADLHRAMHDRLAHLLSETGIVNADPGAMVETNLTFHFLPHGLGHLLGLQTHDVGGFLANREGDVTPAPPQYPALRLTRDIGEGQVFTIEPGLYFIPLLLEQLRAHPLAGQVNWTAIDALLPFGGIRIEDNVAMIGGKPVNLTRDAFRQQEASQH